MNKVKDRMCCRFVSSHIHPSSSAGSLGYSSNGHIWHRFWVCMTFFSLALFASNFYGPFRSSGDTAEHSTTNAPSCRSRLTDGAGRNSTIFCNPSTTARAICPATFKISMARQISGTAYPTCPAFYGTGKISKSY